MPRIIIECRKCGKSKDLGEAPSYADVEHALFEFRQMFHSQRTDTCRLPVKDVFFRTEV